MLKHLIFLLWMQLVFASCPREPSYYHSRVSKLPGDNGFQVKVNEKPEKYVPGQIYTSKYDFSLIQRN